MMLRTILFHCHRFCQARLAVILSCLFLIVALLYSLVVVPVREKQLRAGRILRPLFRELSVQPPSPSPAAAADVRPARRVKVPLEHRSTTNAGQTHTARPSRADAAQLIKSKSKTAQNNGSMHGGLFNFQAPDGILVAKAYRMSNDTIVAIVQRPIPAPNPSQCSFGKYNSTHVTFNQVSWNVERAYVGPMSVVCTFGPGFPSSFASIPAQTKLQIHGLVDDWHEAQAIPVFDFRPQLTKVFGWTVCLPALHGDLRYKWLAQWMSHYVEKLGVQHAFIYSTMTPSLTLAQLADQGVQYANTHASLLDIASQVPFWPINNAQDYTMYDCLTLNRHIQTEWVMFQDFDEVLSIPSDFSSPLNYFRSFKHASALTFGSWGIDMQSCLPAESVTESDRHWPWIARGKRKPEPHCGIMCTVKDEGNRKYALQPQHHCTLAVHEVLDNMRTVHHIPANYGCLLQFQGAASNSQPIDCT
eukprot:scpid50988/ scgid15355/ 